jgi:hypothetical protein
MMRPGYPLPALILIAAVAACGGNGDPGGGIDAPPQPDGPPSSVVEVACAGATIAETVVTAGNSYSPDAVTIDVGDVVRFNPGATHDVNGGSHFRVGIAGDACFRFDEAGVFPFFCTPHQFTGMVTVQ